MPSLFVASITVEPCATSICLPSTSIFSMDEIPPKLASLVSPRGAGAPLGRPGGRARTSYVGGHKAMLVVDVVLEFVAEVLDETLHGQRRGVTQRADRAAGDIVGN